MDIMRRLSTRPDPVDEEQIRRLSMQRRHSSFSQTANDDEPVLPVAIKPSIEVFPSAVSKRQETLLISPNETAKGFIITFAETGKHFLTVATLSQSASSHTKHFYACLDIPETKSRRAKDESSKSDPTSEKLCTLTRDALSFRKRHHIDDPYNGRRLVEMEFVDSSWNTNQMKANIVILNKYSESSPIEPISLKWRGRRSNIEGVLEWKNQPIAVCAKGQGTEAGEFVLYVAPGMDLYVCALVVMAVDDRTRRGSDSSNRSSSFHEKQGEDIQFAEPIYGSSAA